MPKVTSPSWLNQGGGILPVVMKYRTGDTFFDEINQGDPLFPIALYKYLWDNTLPACLPVMPGALHPKPGITASILFMMFFIGEEFIILFTNLHNFINS